MKNIITTYIEWLTICMYWMSVFYTFIKWGTGFGILSLFFPFFPLIDLTKWIIVHYKL